MYSTTRRAGLRDGLLTILTAPGCWFERSRGLNRLNLSLLVTLIMIGVGGLIWREAALNGLPIIGEPVDLAGLTEPGIPPERNAFISYRIAARRLVVDSSTNSMPASIDMRGALSWTEIPDHLKAWLEANQPALNLWLDGTRRDLAHTPGLLITDPVTGRSLGSDLRTLAFLALLDAHRLEHEGQLEPAWKWYVAVLRSSRHVIQCSGWDGREIGQRIYALAYEPVLAWIQKGVPRQLFPRVIDDLLALDAMTPPASRTVAYEYLNQVRVLERAYSRPADLATRIDWFMTNEPRKSRRVLRLLFANWLAQCDKPPFARPEPVSRNPHIFEDPKAPAPARALPSATLRSWHDQSSLAEVELPSFDLCDEVFFERRARAEFIVEIARIAYFLDYGFPPASEMDLVGTILTRLPPGSQPDDP